LTRIVLAMAILLASCAGTAVSGDENFYPLDTGYQWTHQIIEVSHGNAKTTTQVTRNLEEEDIFGHRFTPQRLIGGDLPEYVAYIRVDDDGVFSGGSALGADAPAKNDERTYYIQFPIAVGTTWGRQSHTFLLSENHPVAVEARISKTGVTVTVGAGTFNQCIEISHRKQPSPNTSHISIDWVDFYCSEIGLVSSRYEEKSSTETGSLTMELVAITQP